MKKELLLTGSAVLVWLLLLVVSGYAGIDTAIINVSANDLGKYASCGSDICTSGTAGVGWAFGHDNTREVYFPVCPATYREHVLTLLSYTTVNVTYQLAGSAVSISNSFCYPAVDIKEGIEDTAIPSKLDTINNSILAIEGGGGGIDEELTFNFLMGGAGIICAFLIGWAVLAAYI